jgi:D-amino-acid dehydrogenase
MPDSLPVIGPVAGHPGLLVAVGHGHLGMTDAVRTAERIAGCFA